MALKSAHRSLAAYRRYVRRRLRTLQPLFAQAIIGDFSREIKIPNEDDEFTDLYTGVGIMLGAIREQVEELRRNVEALEAEKAYEEALLSSLGEGVVAIDRVGVVTRANAQLAQMLGTTTAALVGKPLIDAFPIVDEAGRRVGTRCPALQALAEKRRTVSALGQYGAIRTDGTQLPVVITASPILTAGRLTGVISVVRNVTRERAVDQAKTEFVSLASHQLQTPLTTISWSIKPLASGEAGPLNAQQQLYAQKIVRNSQRVIKLVDALLNVSRIELGTFAVEPAPTDLAAVARAVVEELRPQAELKHLRLEEQYPSPPPLVSVDPKLMRIVFENLLSNAIKYTPINGVVGLTLTVRDPGSVIAGHRLPQPSLVAEIADTGCGIPHHQQAQVFSKLFRADNVKLQDTEGTGLGLYIVRSIVQHSGGTIWFTSTEGKGSTFVVAIPLADRASRAGRQPS